MPVTALVDFAAGVLSTAGMLNQDARSMAEMLVHAQATGKNSHGLAHLGVYLEGFRTGALNPRPQFQLLDTLPAAATLEADRAPGALVGKAACDEAIRRAARSGVGVVAVRNSSHFGAASAFVKRMTDRGMAGLVFSNASPSVAPRGARSPIFGTNPIAAGFPRADGAPVLIDIATTAGSRGRIRKAAAEGAAIPDHWALDAQGRPTNDPNAALTGTMQALGGAKGTTLSLLVELLCVALSGGAPGRDALPPQDDSPEPRGISHLFVAFDLGAFGGSEAVAGRVADIARSIEAAAPADPAAPPRLPGARAHDVAHKAQAHGIDISPVLSKTLEAAWHTARAIRDDAAKFHRESTS